MRRFSACVTEGSRPIKNIFNGRRSHTMSTASPGTTSCTMGRSIGARRPSPHPPTDSGNGVEQGHHLPRRELAQLILFPLPA